jgi:hypothetical protein
MKRHNIRLDKRFVTDYRDLKAKNNILDKQDSNSLANITYSETPMPALVDRNKIYTSECKNQNMSRNVNDCFHRSLSYCFECDSQKDKNG